MTLARAAPRSLGVLDEGQVIRLNANEQQVREVPLDHRTDIYSLGVVMFQLLTGRLPFEQDNSYSLLYSIAHDTPPPPSELRPEVPEALDAIVRRATEKDVDRRYQSWSEFSHDLALAYRNLGALLATETALGDTGKFEALRAMRFFHRFAGKAIEDKRPLERYVNESKRLLGVLDGRLEGRDWIAAGLPGPRPEETADGSRGRARSSCRWRVSRRR